MGPGGSCKFHLPSRVPQKKVHGPCHDFQLPNGAALFGLLPTVKQADVHHEQGWHHHLLWVKDDSHRFPPHLWKLHLTAYEYPSLRCDKWCCQSWIRHRQSFSSSYRSWSNKSCLKLGISTKNSIQLIFPQKICNWYHQIPLNLISISPSSWFSFGCACTRTLDSTEPRDLSTSEAAKATRKCKAPRLRFVQPKVLGRITHRKDVPKPLF